MPVVAAGPLLGVDARGWYPLRESVGGDADLPSGVVRSVVVCGADKDRIGQSGGPAVDPVDWMMHDAPLRRNVAGGERAAAVTQDDGAAEWAGDGSGGSAEVQDLAFSAEDGGHDLRVAGH